MRIFLFEFVTGGGFLDLPDLPMPEGTLLREGRAMWRAVHEDLSRLEHVEVHSLRDGRLVDQLSECGNVTSVSSHVREAFLGLAIACDFTLVIAPEFERLLWAYVSGIEALGVRLLGANTHFIEIATDKTATAERLATHGIRVPPGKLLAAGDAVPSDFPLPAVRKVNDGAGSMVELIRSNDVDPSDRVTRIEQYRQGISCSVSFFCRSDVSPIACPPMLQILTADDHMEYLGGKRLMDEQLATRAANLATGAIQAMPATTGYVGVDLVLGACERGSEDYVIEINPRLTTSYVGLREIAHANLGEAMISIAQGSEMQINFSDRPVEFRADGTIL